jgi:hypothetical protein
MRHLPLNLIALALLTTSSTALAADGNDRFTLRLGAINLDADNTLRGSTVVDGRPLSFSEDFGLGGKEWEPRVDGVFRLSDRQRLIFDYFRYNKDRRETLNETVRYDDEVVPAGSFVKADLTYQVASLVYDYAVVDSDSFQLGLQLGAEYAKVGAKAYADLGTVYNGRFLDESEDGIAPVVGARLTFQPGERWLINLQGQYVNTKWGNFDDYDGDLSRANAIVEYRFTDNFGLFAGYDWFRLDVDQSGSDGVIGLKQEFKGPVAGVTLAF